MIYKGKFESRFPLQTPRSNAGRFCLCAMDCGALVHNPLIITHLQSAHQQTSRKNRGLRMLLSQLIRCR